MLDAKIAMSDGTDALRLDLTLCRNFIHMGKRRVGKRYQLLEPRVLRREPAPQRLKKSESPPKGSGHRPWRY